MIEVDALDGIHWSESAHGKLGRALVNVVKDWWCPEQMHRNNHWWRRMGCTVPSKSGRFVLRTTPGKPGRCSMVLGMH